MPSSVTYPATKTAGGPATVLVKGNTATVTDANIASVVGAGNSLHFNAAFTFVVPLGNHTSVLRFEAGQTAVLPANIIAAIQAAGANVTVI